MIDNWDEAHLSLESFNGNIGQLKSSASWHLIYREDYVYGYT